MGLSIREGCIEVEKALSALSVKTLGDRSTLITNVLKAFLNMGFSNARYYDIIFNVPMKDKLCILIRWEGSNALDSKIGYTIDFSESTIGKAYRGKPIVDSYQLCEGGGRFKQWMDDLNLRGKSWIDIPIRYGENLFGLIAADWQGGSADIDPQDVFILDILGATIGAHLTMIPSELTEKAKSRLAEASKQNDTPEELIGSFLDIVCNTLDISIGAAFCFEWDSSLLRKVQERAHMSIVSKVTDFPELYHAGEYLTGTAWLNDDYKYIVSFQSLLKKETHKVATPSLDRHTALLGQITSVLYQKLDRREQQFFLRFMNRSDNSALPLAQWHQDTIYRLSHYLSDSLDELITGKRLASLQQVTKAVAENPDAPIKALDKVFNALKEENFPDCAILWHYVGNTYLAEGYYAGPLFRSWKARPDRAWQDEPLYAQACDASEAKIYYLNTIEGHQDKNLLIGYLYDQGIRTVLAVPISAAKTIGLLVLPLGHSGVATHKPSLSTLKRYHNEKYSAITTYAALVGNIVENAESQYAAEGARRLVGHIGHEVNTPTASIAEISLYALRKVRKTIKADDSIMRLISESEQQIKDERRLISQIMDVAMMMATQHQSLQLYFRKTNICNVLQKASQAVQSTTRLVDASGQEREYHILLNPSCERLGEVVCDAELLQTVFRNLLSNAVKYSLPRYRGEAIEINVIGQPQTGMSILRVTNWGIGIRPQDFERIFRPFVRRELADSRKAIRGLGLGLFIARRIMIAHQGSVFCASSKPTLDDPVRIAAYEGYETVFEVRIPNTLKEGLIEHVWEGWI